MINMSLLGRADAGTNLCGETMTQIRDFTKGNITRQLIGFAWPLFLCNLLQIVYNMVDMIVVGKVVGTVGLSAVAIGSDVTLLLTFLSMGFSNAGQVLVARLIGGGSRQELGRFVGTMAAFLFVCAVAVSVVSLLLQDQLLSLMNTPTQAYEGAMAYSTVCMVGIVFIYGYNGISAVLRGMGDSIHPLIFVAVAAGLNLVLDLVLVWGLQWGPFGAAVATVFSQGISFLSCAVFMFRRRAQFELNIQPGDFLHPDRKMLADLVKLGLPMALKSASVQISKMFVNAWINSYGIAVSAFAGITGKLSTTANLVSNAMSITGSTMVGQNIAAGEYGRVNQVLLRLLVITTTVAGAMSLVMCLFPRQVVALFADTGDAGVMALVDGYVPIAVIYFLGSGWRGVLNALINGSGNHRINFVTALLDGVVMRIGLSVLFGLVLDMKHYGFWLGDALAGFTIVGVGIVYYLSGRWKNKRLC